MMHQSVESVLRTKASDEIVSVEASATVAEAVATMAARRVGAVLIMNEDKLVAWCMPGLPPGPRRSRW
jgi:CBS domain-containing protein